MRRRTRLGHAATGLCIVAAVMLPAACGEAGADDPGAAPSAGSSPAAPGASAGSGQSTNPGAGVTAIPADNVLEPVGPRTGPVYNPDILITSKDTLSPDTVAAIQKLPEVIGLEQFSLSQTIIENQALRVAAVDPATYRSYTALNVADTQEVWERVAAGELALRSTLADELTKEKGDYYRLGSTEKAPLLHLGARVETVANVDAVVNEAWADDLGMVRDNALLIRLDDTSPPQMRKEIERIAAGATVSMLDAIATFGLDPDVQQTAIVTGTVADAVGVFRYTVLGGGRIAPEPAWVAEHISTEAVPILGTITCNKDLFPQLRAAFEEIVARGLADKIIPEQYAGCYYPRFIAGSTTLSNHSFGLALDMNVPGNLRGTVGEMDRTVVSIFKKWGFGWGGDWSYTDPMHFEMNRLVTPAEIRSAR
jgi:hypothetical protein